ncbi:hypothetical protein [Photobacterium sp. GB-72]|uniref:hypothetical protein n=1 Tax=Photobacterium sp. GB-72 TaxID=2022105 RepID=UPI000D15258D|nr:hypothetical protein [Photobacterium sp. GB-72]PSV32329.1 hypothetical protein C9J40_03905 [Photobacterium sp. GB-72]
MIFTFKNPKNLEGTGINFLRTLIYKYIKGSTQTSSLLLLKRRFTKNTEKAIFCPVGVKCFLSKPGDVILLPDDSFRSISSVAKVRFFNKEYAKAAYQYVRLFFYFLLFTYLKGRRLLTVSKEDQQSLQKRFIRHDIDYVNHPIQMKINKCKPKSLSSYEFNDMLFLNLQDFYTCSPQSFFTENHDCLFKLSKLGFHGSNAKNWRKIAKIKGYHNVTDYDFVEDFPEFIKGFDIVVMPLIAGAGVKNIMLNAIYLNVMVFGTKEAFSGVPEELYKPFLVNSMNDINYRILNNSSFELERHFSKLRSFIVDEHCLDKFVSKVLKNDM